MCLRLAVLLVLATLLSWSVVSPAAGQTPVLIKGPYLQNVTQTSIVIMWETYTETPSWLEYNDPAIQIGDPTLVTLHEMMISGLNTGTTYDYRVNIDGQGELWTDWFTFRTAPAADRPFRLVVYGDTRSHPDDHAAVIRGIVASEPALVLHTGDLVNDGHLASGWNREFFGPAAPLLRTTPLFPVLGNHEDNASLYYDLFSLPGNEEWFAITYGSARIIGLNTSSSFGSGSEQYDWLVNELESPEYQAAQWHLVFFHYPPFAGGGHEGDTRVQQNLVPLFETYGVDMVFNGHNHHYERSAKSGVAYIVTGGGGAPLYDFDEDAILKLNEYSQAHAATLHFCVLDITPDEIAFTARNVDGAVIDTLTIPAVVPVGN
jgi:3',5'-cyclic AMP phosphodiesterase CpdA